MARFESPLQIVGLFICASFVAIGVIYVLNLEAAKRYGEKSESPVTSEEPQPPPGFLDQFGKKLKALLKIQDSQSRRKRSAAEENFTTVLSENLLTESLNRRKLRDVPGKVALLDPTQDEITAEILRQFCPKNDATKTSADPFNNTKIELQFKILEDNEALDEPVFTCQSYGNLVLTVLITTVVNFSFVAIVMICKVLCSICSHEEQDNPPFCTNCCVPEISETKEGYIDDEDFFAISGLQSDDKTPIIKNSANIAI